MATAKTNCSEVPENTDVVKKFSQPWGNWHSTECQRSVSQSTQTSRPLQMGRYCNKCALCWRIGKAKTTGFLPTGAKMLRTSKYNHKAHKSKKPNLHLRGNYRMYWYFFSYDCDSVLSWAWFDWSSIDSFLLVSLVDLFIDNSALHSENLWALVVKAF